MPVGVKVIFHKHKLPKQNLKFIIYLLNKTKNKLNTSSKLCWRLIYTQILIKKTEN